MLKKLASKIATKAKTTVTDTTSKITDMLEIQQYVLRVISKMDEGEEFWDWSKGYWAKYDDQNRVIPVVDRKAYMKSGKSFKKGKVYLVGPKFKGEISTGAPIGDLGTVYNLDELKQPVKYAVAKSKDKVMLFNWK